MITKILISSEDHVVKPEWANLTVTEAAKACVRALAAKSKNPEMYQTGFLPVIVFEQMDGQKKTAHPFVMDLAKTFGN